MYIFRRIKLLCAIVASLVVATSCIHNDLPYPQIQPNFTEFLVNGLTEPAQIDTLNRTITLSIDEATDLSKIELVSYHLVPEGAYIAEGELDSVLNLLRPIYVETSLYQDYIWTIKATQNIERYFTIDGQMGQTVIDVPGRRIIVYVTRGVNISALKVTSAKLGGTNSAISPDPVGQTMDFRAPVDLEVTDFGVTTTWTVFVEEIDAAVTLERADAWTRVAWLYAAAKEGADNGFEYRMEGAEEWTKVPAEWITTDGGSITARLIHLSPATTYEARAYSDLDTSAPVEFTTGEEAQLPNATFENWWLDGRVYNPWAEGGTPFWDTGNKGAATLGPSNSVPTEETQTGTGLAAQLNTEFKGIAGLGKIAAGNIFTGVYVRTDGTNGILNFGREFSQRPTRLRAWYHYTSAPISHVGSEPEYADWKGLPDSCQVYIALTDWPEPFEIRTNPKNRQLFSPSDPHVIAYGQMTIGETIPNWTELQIELRYRATNRTPRYILVVCSASKYGDFFVGGQGSQLTIDDLTLDYDY